MKHGPTCQPIAFDYTGALEPRSYRFLAWAAGRMHRAASTFFRLRWAAAICRTLGLMATRSIRAHVPNQSPSHADTAVLAFLAAELATQSIDVDAPLVAAAGMEVTDGPFDAGT